MVVVGLGGGDSVVIVMIVVCTCIMDRILGSLECMNQGRRVKERGVR